MFGVVNQLYICNQQRSRELNDRITIRNVPSAPLQPQYSMRPVLTKYSIMPILDQRATDWLYVGACMYRILFCIVIFVPMG